MQAFVVILSVLAAAGGYYWVGDGGEVIKTQVSALAGAGITVAAIGIGFIATAMAVLFSFAPGANVIVDGAHRHGRFSEIVTLFAVTAGLCVGLIVISAVLMFIWPAFSAGQIMWWHSLAFAAWAGLATASVGYAYLAIFVLTLIGRAPKPLGKG